ncbi:hypothetical protein Tco_1258949 [Tanacetum coccineum]
MGPIRCCCRVAVSVPIAVGTIWRRLVSKVSAAMIGYSLDGYLNDLQFGVGVSRCGEAILHVVNRLIENQGDDVGLSMLLVDFKNAFNMVDREVMLQEVRLCCLAISSWVEFCYSSPARLYVTSIDISRLAGVFPPNIARPSHGVKLLGGPASVDFDFSSELMMKRVAKSIEVMDDVAKINDPQCELLLLRACAGASKLYFAMRTRSPRVFERAQWSFDAALRSALERIITASGLGFGDVLNYAFLASRLQTASLQTRLLRHSDIATFGPTFDNALNAFIVKIETDLLSNSSAIAAPKLMKKLADIYFTRVTQTAESSFFLSSRQMALWKSQIEDHTSD